MFICGCNSISYRILTGVGVLFYKDLLTLDVAMNLSTYLAQVKERVDDNDSEALYNYRADVVVLLEMLGVYEKWISMYQDEREKFDAELNTLIPGGDE